MECQYQECGEDAVACDIGSERLRCPEHTVDALSVYIDSADWDINRRLRRGYIELVINLKAYSEAFLR